MKIRKITQTDKHIYTEMAKDFYSSPAVLDNIPEDMKFFREQTTNNIVVMGYNTWLSLNEKKLPNRENIVLTDEQKATINAKGWTLAQ